MRICLKKYFENLVLPNFAAFCTDALAAAGFLDACCSTSRVRLPDYAHYEILISLHSLFVKTISPVYLMGPIRKRPRTTPRSVDEPESATTADGRPTPTLPSTTVADSSSKAPSVKDDASVRLKSPVEDIKAGWASAKDVSIIPLVGPHDPLADIEM